MAPRIAIHPSPRILLPLSCMTDPSPLVIVGAGGLGREVAALVETINACSPTWKLTGFVDDAEDLQGTSVMNYPVRGPVDWLCHQQDLHFVIAIGDGATRHSIATKLKDAPVRPATLTHPSVTVHRTTDIGPGSIICKEVSLTVDIQLGSHVVLHPQCTVGHDTVLAPFVTLLPGSHISGSASLETGVSLGSDSIVLPNVEIGSHSTVGAGGVVTEDLPTVPPSGPLPSLCLDATLRMHIAVCILLFFFNTITRPTVRRLRAPMPSSNVSLATTT